jgi:hypothetical protein
MPSASSRLPAHVDALFNLGNLRRDLAQSGEAVACFKEWGEAQRVAHFPAEGGKDENR